MGFFLFFTFLQLPTAVHTTCICLNGSHSPLVVPFYRGELDFRKATSPLGWSQLGKNATLWCSPLR